MIVFDGKQIQANGGKRGTSEGFTSTIYYGDGADLNTEAQQILSKYVSDPSLKIAMCSNGGGAAGSNRDGEDAAGGSGASMSSNGRDGSGIVGGRPVSNTDGTGGYNGGYCNSYRGGVGRRLNSIIIPIKSIFQGGGQSGDSYDGTVDDGSGSGGGAAIGNLFGCMIASVLPDVFIGMFGDKLINYEYDRSKGVLWNNKKSFTAGGECGGATENGLFAFLDKCVKDKIKVDNLYVISDMQIGDGESVVWEKSSNYKYGKFAELLKGFKKVNPNCKIVSISIQGYGSEMFYRGSNILNIAGWSESIFDVINSKFCGYKNMIDEIKKIKI